MTTDTSYAAAQRLSGSIRIGGNTYDNRSWLHSQGARWDAGSKTWKLTLRGGNKVTQSLLAAIVQRGMTYEQA